MTIGGKRYNIEAKSENSLLAKKTKLLNRLSKKR
jgi:hypothetical protein